MSTPTPLDARKTWRTLEPLHGMIYFAPEATAQYEALGMHGAMGYFASRAAPMGPVGAEVVVATFFNFCPRLVAQAIPAAWALAPPSRVLEGRVAAADGALTRMLPDDIASPQMARAAELLRRAAERACERPEGRPLFAGHAGLGWPEAPHLVLWHAQSLLREFRGDGHVAALLTAGLSPLEALVVHAATGEVSAEILRTTRNWTEAEWAGGVDAVRARGWLADGEGLALSPSGAAQHQEIEDLTDRLAVSAYQALSAAECDELRQLARPFSQTVVAAGFGGLAPTTAR
jgi:hypothetical protein